MVDETGLGVSAAPGSSRVRHRMAALFRLCRVGGHEFWGAGCASCGGFIQLLKCFCVLDFWFPTHLVTGGFGRRGVAVHPGWWGVAIILICQVLSEHAVMNHDFLSWFNTSCLLRRPGLVQTNLWQFGARKRATNEWRRSISETISLAGGGASNLVISIFRVLDGSSGARRCWPFGRLMIP